MPGRIIGTRLPCCPGKDSRFTLRHNMTVPGTPWWVHYEPPGGNPIPSDDPHTDLVNMLLKLKREMVGTEGGAFSINEHGQVIARAKSQSGPGNTVHMIEVTSAGGVFTYTNPIRFNGGALDPCSAPVEGTQWTGPLSGMTYSFAAPGNPKPPSRNLDEIFVEEEGITLQLSAQAAITPYPPASGSVQSFLHALRRRLPEGGRFRVNEQGRAFTSHDGIYIATIPTANWFPPLTPRS